MKALMETSNVIPVVHGPVFPRGERSMGALLMHAGRLSPESTEKILKVQHEQGLRFGEAALSLGLLDAADIEQALSRQFDSPYLLHGKSKVSEHVVSAYLPFGAQAGAVSTLRGRLLLHWEDRPSETSVLAIVSADRGEGRSFVASNLAVAFSQLGQKTLLIDADMRHPDQHNLFDIANRSGLSAMLSGRATADAVIHHVPGLPGLSVLPAGAQPPNPLELLARPLFPQLLAELAPDYEVIIVDTPAIAEHTDAQSIAARASSVLIVTRKGTSRLSRVRDAADAMSQAGTTIVGTVLNDF